MPFLPALAASAAGAIGAGATAVGSAVASGASAIGGGISGAIGGIGEALSGAGAVAADAGAFPGALNTGAASPGGFAGAGPDILTEGRSPGRIADLAGARNQSFSGRLGDLLGEDSTGGGILSALGSKAPALIDTIGKSGSLGEFIINASEADLLGGGGQGQALGLPSGAPIQFQSRARPEVKPLNIGEILVGLGVQ